MNAYYYESKSVEYLQGNFIEAETLGKAKYQIWLNGACEYFDSFGDFLRDIKIRNVSASGEKYDDNKIN